MKKATGPSIHGCGVGGCRRLDEGTVLVDAQRIIQMQQQYLIIVNLSQLKAANSLTLAVLVRWLRQTPEAKGLLFKAVPEQMLKIIQSCHLENDLQMI